ncbi:MAG TPA: polymer-forming cytoskeletal protein [Bellilinea sp.]|nr:polymer-forming cytoskeletal protein [Bellilinea sp.]
MFRRNQTPPPTTEQILPIERVTSVLGPGINWQGNLRGTGGVRIEGIFSGELSVRGIVVVSETGRVTCEKEIVANTVVVAGSVKANIRAEKIEIRSTGRVWGDVTTVAFATEEGAFLRGAVRMEEKIELPFAPEVSQETEPGTPASGAE